MEFVDKRRIETRYRIANLHQSMAKTWILILSGRKSTTTWIHTSADCEVGEIKNVTLIISVCERKHANMIKWTHVYIGNYVASMTSK